MPKSSQAHPQLVALIWSHYTLWDLWIDTHVTGPLKRHEDTVNQVLDTYGEPISFYKDVPHILHNIRSRSLQMEASAEQEDRKVVIAACSRTHAPDLAHQCLRLLLVPSSHEHSSPMPKPAIEFFDELEIYPGSKITHFKSLHERTGIPYADMVMQ
ncbi:magnesium-dependent phosphatase-1 [Flammula alnicola]|nr:magnesium-dependent phosphatase-1 [Flammula alnicola]